MRVSISIGSEIDIDLTNEELSRLERETLRGEGVIRELPNGNRSRRIELLLGEMKSNLFVEAKSYPEKACFESITRYVVSVSRRGYGLLKEKGAVCDRTDRIGGPSRVNIHVR
ncbi:hypothetical protein HYT58_02840 [Candidatus Woesearchaeota archaeon]|nr:hypothetical protein [Candidatus Woesearchaeota archaeon]